MEDVRRLPVGEGSEEIAVTLDEPAREGARRMIAAALEAEVDWGEAKVGWPASWSTCICS